MQRTNSSHAWTLHKCFFFSFLLNSASQTYRKGVFPNSWISILTVSLSSARRQVDFKQTCGVEQFFAKVQLFSTFQIHRGVNREPCISTTVNKLSASRVEIFSECNAHLSRPLYQTAASVHALTVLSCRMEKSFSVHSSLAGINVINHPGVREMFGISRTLVLSLPTARGFQVPPLAWRRTAVATRSARTPRRLRRLTHRLYHRVVSLGVDVTLQLLLRSLWSASEL